MDAADKEIQRLIQSDLLTIEIEKEKSFKDLIQKLIDSSISVCKEKLKKKLTLSIKKKKTVHKIKKFLKNKIFIRK